MVAAVTIASPSPFTRIWAAYERSLRRRPILTQAVSSALLWGVGDGLAQRIETRGQGALDARRVALTAAFGGAIIGPAGHGWYLMLEHLVQRLGLACSMKSMLLKVAVDNLIFSPCYVLAFFAYGCMVIDGLSPATFVEKMREEFVPTMLAEAMVWPPYMAAVFSRVPVKHQLLAVNVATLFDVCFLSWVRCKHEEVAAGATASEASKQSEFCSSETERHQPLVPTLEKAGLGPAAGPSYLSEGGAALPGSDSNLLTMIAASITGAAVSMAAAMAGGSEQQQRQQPLEAPPRTAGEARRRELAAAMWDTTPEPSLGRMALMAASATCSTGGGGWVRMNNSAPAGQSAAGAPTPMAPGSGAQK